MSGNNNVNLPPGFRFYPTEEELVVHFLQRKAALLPCHPDVIPDLDLYPYDPWELDGKALAEGRQWYYYSRRTQNRITENGYWKAIGIDEPVLTNANKRVGIKKYSLFYVGEAPGGMKTNWIMEEYRLSSSDCPSSSRSSKRRGHPKIFNKLAGL
ncbi:NAC domain-containing protein 104 isoform X2 [Ricinus communis]|uniref:NAC domain-containing protein 104 isoform X2 n=1 Tax=Ricinus communis TaxID=3988 RepID=UPI000D68D579|nr:NAC domain-containing protein 104 isoform X2 [Ricinus communis]|eukprot:XP_025014771.1 NAC domain-containing protein 104 isoform X2 [Ricinus communis]